MKWAYAAVALAVAVAIGAAYFRNGSTAESGPSSMAGHPAAGFPLASLDGKVATLSSLRGQIVVLNLWASWCPPCRAEMPDLERLYAAYRRRGVVVVGVDEGESASQAAAFARSLDVTYPIWLDERQQYGRAYEALGLPTTVLIDRGGTVVRGYDGALAFSQMVDAVRPLLGASR